jgi:hypothetical protein
MSYVSGEIQCNSALSGVPDLTMRFANPLLINDVRYTCVVTLEDIIIVMTIIWYFIFYFYFLFFIFLFFLSLHPCVRYYQWVQQKVISFVPPDGLFTLVRYRAGASSTPIPPPISCVPEFYIKKEGGGGTFRLAVCLCLCVVGLGLGDSDWLFVCVCV